MKDEIFDVLLNMEIELDLFSKQVNGFHFWMYYRVSLFEKINNELCDLGEGFAFNKISAKHLLSLLAKVITTPKYDIMRKVYKANYAVFCDPSRFFIDGKYVSPFTDYFYELLCDKIAFERPYNYEHQEPLKTKNVILLDRIYWVRALKQCLPIRRKKEHKSQIVLILREIIEYLNKYGIPSSINIDDEAESILSLLSRYYYIKKKFSKLIALVEPHVIIEVQYYNFENMVLNEIAKSRGITTIEMQHGLISRKHFAYNFRYDNEIEQLPDYLFTFGEYWRHAANYSIKNDHIVSVGYPYFEQEIQKVKCKHVGESKNTVIFLSQGTIGNKLHKLAIDYSKIAKDDVNVVYKLHPGEFLDWRKRYPDLASNSRINVVTNNIPLYDLFAIANTIIGVSSTTVYEGLAFGLQVYIYDIDESDHLRQLYTEGATKLIRSASEIVSDVNRCYKINYERFWKSNGIENIIKELRRIEHE